MRWTVMCLVVGSFLPSFLPSAHSSELAVRGVVPTEADGKTLEAVLKADGLVLNPAADSEPARFVGDETAIRDALRRLSAALTGKGVRAARALIDGVVVFWVQNNGRMPAVGIGRDAILVVNGLTAEGKLIGSRCTLYVVGASSLLGAGGEARAASVGGTCHALAFGGAGPTGGDADADGQGGAFALADGSIAVRGDSGSARALSRLGGTEAEAGDSGLTGGDGGKASAQGTSATAIGGRSFGGGGFGGVAQAIATRSNAFAQGGHGGMGAAATIVDLARNGGKGGDAKAVAPRRAEAHGGKGGSARGAGMVSGDGGDATAIGGVPSAEPGKAGDTFAGATPGKDGRKVETRRGAR